METWPEFRWASEKACFFSFCRDISGDLYIPFFMGFIIIHYENPFWKNRVLNVHGHSGDDCIRAEKNHASEECGKCEKWSHVGNKPVTTWGSMLYFHKYLAMNMLFLHIFAMTKPYQKHQHEPTFNIFVAVIFFGFASLFSKICSFSEVPFYGPVLQCAATISSTQKVLNRAQPGVSWATKKKRPNFPLNHLLVNGDSCNGLWRNPHIRVV